MSYYCYYTTLKDVKKAEGSDRLYTATCMGEQVIVGIDSFEGQEVIYFPADGQLDYDFALKFNLLRKDKEGNKLGGYLEYPSMHIKALKLRGLVSEGITIPAIRVKKEYPDLSYSIGDEFDTIGKIKICRKYIPTQKVYSGGHGSKNNKHTEGIKYPMFAQHTDTKQLMYSKDYFHYGDRINISLKIHGTSQRSMNTYKELPRGFFRKLFRMKPKKERCYALGTRRTVINTNSSAGGFYGDNEFRIKHHEKIKPFVEEGMTVYYEIAGWVNDTTTIMSIGDNTKINDKEFIKEFGDKTIFRYGCDIGESEMFVYRITAKNGEIEYTPQQIVSWCLDADVRWVPQIADFEFTTWENLIAFIDNNFKVLADPIDSTHVKEGLVIRIVDRRNFTAFKVKTVPFKIIEGIIKESATEADIEESQDLMEEGSNE